MEQGESTASHGCALVEFQKQPVDVRDRGKVTHFFRGIHGIYLENVCNENPKLTSCTWNRENRPLVTDAHWLILRNDQSKLKTAGENLPIVLEESMEYTSENVCNKKPKLTSCLEQGGSTTSYRCALVEFWETTSRCSRLQGNFTHHFRGIYWMYLKNVCKENPKLTFSA